MVQLLPLLLRIDDDVCFEWKAMNCSTDEYCMWPDDDDDDDDDDVIVPVSMSDTCIPLSSQLPSLSHVCWLLV